MISKYLKVLLANNKRVIIPDFGGFVVKRSSAGDIISFNSFLNFNDDLLATIIVEQEEVDKSQALIKMKAFVIEINSSLDAHGKYEIEEVGYLVKDKKGNVRFVDVIDDVAVTEFPDENTADDVQQKTDASVSGIEEVLDLIEDVKDVKKIDSTMGEDNKKKKKRTPWIILAIIIIAITSWTVVQYVSNNGVNEDEIELVSGSDNEQSVGANLFEKHNKIVEKKANDQMNVSVTSEKQGLLRRIVTFFKGLFVKDAEPVSPVIEVEEVKAVEYIMVPFQVDTVSGVFIVADKNIAPKGKERYNVIIGAFTDKENAIKFNQELIEDTYASEIFDRYNGFNAVSMGAYPSLDIALKVCGEQLKETPDVWVLVK